MKTTINYGFKQPEGTDIVNIDDISDNFGSVDTEIKKANDKVVAHEGKGGSVHADVTTTTSGFMSAADKVKLNGVATNANNYSHPTGDGNLHVPATGTSNSGKVLKAGATAGSLAWGTLTSTDVGALPTSHQGQGGSVHADVTTSASGFMSAGDKTKLNGIAAGAQTNQNAVQSIQAVTSSGTAIGTATAASATDTIQLKEGSNIDIAVSGKTLTLNNTYSYTHPASDGNLHVPATGTSNNGKVLKAGSTAGSLAWGTLTSTDVGALPTSHQGQGGSVHADVTTSASGFMSAVDKTKLNGIELCANNYIHPITHSPSIISQDSNNRFVTDGERKTWADTATTVAKNNYQGVRVSTTEGTKANKWWLVRSYKLTYQYAAVTDVLDIIGGTAGIFPNMAKLLVRVNQQEIMGNRPTVSFLILDNLNLSLENFKLVLIENSSANTIINLYIKDPFTWSALNVYGTLRNGGSGVITGEPDIVPLDTLPTGIQQYDATNMSSLLTSNGYTKLRDGTIIQWGLAQFNQGGAQESYATITFPITFPNLAFTVNCNTCQVDGVYSAIQVFIANGSIISNSQFVLKARNTNGPGGTNIKVYWIAIGC